MSKKNNHTHKTIFTWFDNLLTSTELQGFHYYHGKIQSVAVQYFSLSRTTTTTENPNHQNCFFYILHIGYTMGYKTCQIFFFLGALPLDPQEACP